MVQRQVLLRAVLIGLLVTAAARAQAPQAPPSKPVRGAQEVQADLQIAGAALRDAIGPSKNLRDPAKRAEVAVKAIPAARKLAALYEEMAAANPQFKSIAEGAQTEMLALLSLLGDDESGKQLSAIAAGSDARATQARSSKLITDWFKANNDAAAQNKVLDDADALSKAKPEDNDVASAIASIAQQPAATPEIHKRVVSIATTNLKGPMAEQMKEQLLASEKLKELVDKPLVLEGIRFDGAGGKLSTADLKGKVVLVDFWATWCVPCVAALPDIKKVYTEYHPKGLEIVGISSDEDAADLKAFLAADPEMKWPQLFDSSKPGWHPLATQYGVLKLPTMFLIDKKGIVRSTEANDDFQDLIPKLLAE